MTSDELTDMLESHGAAIAAAVPEREVLIIVAAGGALLPDEIHVWSPRSPARRSTIVQLLRAAIRCVRTPSETRSGI